MDQYNLMKPEAMGEDNSHPHNPAQLLYDADLNPMIQHPPPNSSEKQLNSPATMVPSSRDVHIFSSGHSANKMRKAYPYYQQLIRKYFDTWNSLYDRREANGRLIETIMGEIDNAYFYDNRGGSRLVSKTELAELIKQKMRDEKRKRNTRRSVPPVKRAAVEEEMESMESIQKKQKLDWVAAEEVVKRSSHQKPIEPQPMVVSMEEVAKVDQEIMELVQTGTNTGSDSDAFISQYICIATEPELTRVVTPNTPSPSMIDMNEIFQGPQGLQDLAALDQLMLLPDDDAASPEGLPSVTLRPKKQQQQPGEPGFALVGTLQRMISDVKDKDTHNKELFSLVESLCRVYQSQCQTVCALQTVCQEREKIIDRILGAPFGAKEPFVPF